MFSGFFFGQALSILYLIPELVSYPQKAARQNDSTKNFKIIVSSAITVLGLRLVPLLASPDFSTYPDVTPAQCENASSTPIINRCSYLEARATDKALNIIYQQVKNELTGQQRQKLIDAELAWIKYRDASCDIFLATDERGVRIYYRVSTSLYWNCITQVTKQRIALLSAKIE